MLILQSILKDFILFIFILINIHYIFSTLVFEYPTSITLSNGNILVAEKYGIFLCDPIFSTIISNVTFFNTQDQISTEEDLSKVILKRKAYIIYGLINYKIYIFNTEGSLLFKNNTKSI